MRTGALIRVIPNEQFADSLDNKIGLVLGPSFHTLYPFRVLIDEREAILCEDEMEEIVSDD